MSELTLDDVRAKIDALDFEIQALITQRAYCAEKVAQAKRTAVEVGQDIECYRPAREAEVLRTVAERNHGPLEDAEMTLIFQEIMSACRRLQRPLSVAYLGPQGTFTQMATVKHFGHFINAMAESSIEDIFKNVALGEVDYGVVPVENSVEGSVTPTVDRFIAADVKICGEIQLPIHHCFLSKETSLGRVRKVYAHQQALAQCRVWMQNHLNNVELIPMASNAEAAIYAADTVHSAAIACDIAADIYQLNRLQVNIEDDVNNATRFLVIGKKDADATGKDKTSLLLSAPNRPGSLYELLQPMAAHGISMTRIESRPSRQANWEYVFFVDIQGHHQEPFVAQALAALKKNAVFFKLLGSYPCSVH